MRTMIPVVLTCWLAGCATTSTSTEAPDDVMPAILTELIPAYPRETSEQGVSGKVRVQVDIDAEGGVTGASIVDGPDSGLHAASLRAIRQFRYRPATRGGVAVPYALIHTFNFQR